ncbi:hypothetical protein ACSU64_09580 [Bacillaceae bacterium C204]|uniref:hypothetical protein n=1 Tax=Neobacillus sp. 204 TaxID=3383351 RepID=UPI00397C6B59
MLQSIYRYLIIYIVIQLLVSVVYPTFPLAVDVIEPTITEPVSGDNAEPITTPSTDEGVETTTNPVLSITTDVKGNEVTVNGQIIAEGDLSEVQLKIDGGTDNFVPIPFDESTGNFSYIMPKEFNDGKYTYRMTATPLTGSPTEVDFSFTVDTKLPSLKVTSSRLQNKNVTISGTVKDNITSGSEIILQLYNKSDPNTLITINNTINNQWTYTFPDEFVEGQYNYIIRATDSNENYTERSYSFYVGELPKVASIKVNYADVNPTTGERTTPLVDLLTSEDMNHVTTNTKITVRISDNMITADTIKNPIAVLNSEGGSVEGVISEPQKIGDDIQVDFTPNGDSFNHSTTYYVLINPLLINKNNEDSNWTTDFSGNPLLPLIRKFTTEREPNISEIPGDKQGYHQLKDPHGNNGMNTNTCSTCHSTHASNLREKTEQQNSNLGDNLQQTNFEYSTYNYCMACHDGTVAPMPENMHQNNHTPKYSNSTSSVINNAGDCASCHNPHLSWSKENPNRLKDHFVHTHNDTGIGTIDSLDQPCEMCHDSDSQKVKDQYIYEHNDITKKDNEEYPYYPYGQKFNSQNQPCEKCHISSSKLVSLIKEYDSKNQDQPIAVNYKVLQYRNANATGIPDDYALCFRCHDGSKKWTDSEKNEHTITDIKQYYDVDKDDNDTTNSNLSAHRITAIDGSNLVKTDGTTSNDGHIPCAVCHDTHGSDSINILNKKLGLEDRRTLSTVSGDWDNEKERKFCITCHNGSTAIYGVTGKAIFDETTGITLDQTNTEHNRESTKACSECHGTGKTIEEKAMSAAHAPMVGLQ